MAADQEPLSVGFRFGDKGTHTSRTLMLAELTALLDAVSATGSRAEYVAAIVEANCLGKRTAATRRLTGQRLRELYGLDRAVPLFCVLRRLWSTDVAGRPLLALLAALARDPLLAATAPAVVSIPLGAELSRSELRSALRAVVGERLNENVLDKVARNAASSWTQSGHLQGRTFKKRRQVRATPPVMAFALYLAAAAGFRGEALLTSAWASVLDCSPSAARALALDAKRLGLLDLRTSGNVFELDLRRLDELSGVS
jgi:hypothetical protein